MTVKVEWTGPTGLNPSYGNVTRGEIKEVTEEIYNELVGYGLAKLFAEKNAEEVPATEVSDKKPTKKDKE